MKGLSTHTIENLEVLLRKANGGDVEAQVELGLYYDDDGVNQNYTEAAHWFLKAANQGNVHSQHYLSIMNLYGQGMPKNETEALNWCIKAANNGHGQAMYDLGVIYEYGDTEDWITKAAHQGFAFAETDLGAIISLEKEYHKVIQKQPNGFLEQRNKGTQKPNTA